VGGVKVCGYIRVSTSEQADSGAGLEAQRAAITAEATRRGWELGCVYEDAGASGKSLSGRPGLLSALEVIESGSAEALVVAKLDRLSRSLLDFAGLMERARTEGWSLVALDLGVDTSTPSGELMANVLATFAQFERRLIGQRTRDALAVKRAQGVRLGRPREVPPAVVRRILELHRSGHRVAEIARMLNCEGVRTPRSGRWHPPGVARVLSWQTEA
jgi:DNA invertase Pin-like site-specific DNA recombinase